MRAGWSGDGHLVHVLTYNNINGEARKVGNVVGMTGVYLCAPCADCKFVFLHSHREPSSRPPKFLLGAGGDVPTLACTGRDC